MPTNSIFLFEYEHKESGGEYDIYLFKDFSGDAKSDQEDIFSEIDIIRQRIPSPNKVIVICKNTGNLNKKELKERFTEKKRFKYINYEKINDDLFNMGASEIIKKNKIVQISPEGTLFKHPSKTELNYFYQSFISIN